MRIVCNRYNPTSLIEFMEPIGSRINYGKRWQVTLVNKGEYHYDHFFVTKPTRKQIRKLHKGIK